MVDAVDKKLFAEGKYVKLVAHALHGGMPTCQKGCGCVRRESWESLVKEFASLLLMDNSEFNVNEFYEMCEGIT